MCGQMKKKKGNKGIRQRRKRKLFLPRAGEQKRAPFDSFDSLWVHSKTKRIEEAGQGAIARTRAPRLPASESVESRGQRGHINPGRSTRLFGRCVRGFVYCWGQGAFFGAAIDYALLVERVPLKHQFVQRASLEGIRRGLESGNDWFRCYTLRRSIGGE